MTAEQILPWVALIALGATAVITWVGTRQEVEHDPEDDRLSEFFIRHHQKELEKLREQAQRSLERHRTPKGGDD